MTSSCLILYIKWKFSRKSMTTTMASWGEAKILANSNFLRVGESPSSNNSNWNFLTENFFLFCLISHSHLYGEKISLNILMFRSHVLCSSSFHPPNDVVLLLLYWHTWASFHHHKTSFETFSILLSNPKASHHLEKSPHFSFTINFIAPHLVKWTEMVGRYKNFRVRADMEEF